MEKELDVRGEICPYPMMQASEALKKLAPGETLQVLTDHTPALITIPWEAAKHGFQASIDAAGASEWRITLTPVAGKSQQELVADLSQKLAAAGVQAE
jgi:tRNA 2-thiouridine synthesizing protein A